ncbi:MAG TPA: Calx-beta domain-containing protein [Steroidobacteraceae bacterium]|nr:Calx-beta domain-containing protein [Steroidobacteraceae bacterium]
MLHWLRLLIAACLLGVTFAAVGDAVQYTYDALGRLASACYPNQSKLVTYTYDAAGNRKQLTTTAVSCGGPAFVIDNAVPVRAGTPLTVKVRRLGPINATNAVNYATANGTAIAGTHYTATSGTLTFVSGDFEKSFTVNTTVGSVPTGGVSLFANLSSPTGGATIQTAQATGTINPNAAPVANNDEHWGTYTVFQTATVYVLPNDVDPDGDPLTITNAVCESSGCLVSVVSGQYLEVTGTTPIFKIVRYWISDGQGGTANATVQVAEFFEEDPNCGEFWC